MKEPILKFSVGLCKSVFKSKGGGYSPRGQNFDQFWPPLPCLCRHFYKIGVVIWATPSFIPVVCTRPLRHDVLCLVASKWTWDVYFLRPISSLFKETLKREERNTFKRKEIRSFQSGSALETSLWGDDKWQKWTLINSVDYLLTSYFVQA